MNKSFKKVSILIPCLFLPLPLFAQMPQGLGGMQSLADTILGIFTGDFIKVILAIFLCGSAVAYAFNKDNEKIKRNCIAIGIATAILITASSIVGAVMAASRG
jgi:hypothetical protein